MDIGKILLYLYIAEKIDTFASLIILRIWGLIKEETAHITNISRQHCVGLQVPSRSSSAKSPQRFKIQFSKTKDSVSINK